MKHISILLLLAISISAFGQKMDQAITPLELPVEFSGTYGELRTDHFHAGFDFRTGGTIGHKLRAIKDGYISRVSVSPGGYGNGLYITHKDGTMSVYGHMSRFTDAVAAKVLEAQYKNENYTVNLFFTPEDFPVKQGDYIGLSGNTGSSGGPHLHLEIRKDGGNLPTNFLRDGVYSYDDTMAPVIQRVAFFAYEDSTGIPTKRKLAINSTPGGTIKVPEKSYIAIDAIDKIPGSPYKMGVEIYKVMLDGLEFFQFTKGDISYSEQSYIESMIAYGENGDNLIKTHIDPGNGLKYKIKGVGNGIITLNDYEPHQLRIEVTDYTGNTTGANYTLIRDDSIHVSPDGDSSFHYPMLWYTPNTVNTSDFSITLPSGALYNSADFTYRKIADADPDNGIYSPIWVIGDATVPLAKQATIKFKVNGPDSLLNRMYLARYNESNGKMSAAGGEFKNGGILYKGDFGTYCVVADTIAPVVKPVTASGASIGDTGEVYFNMTDNDSGIADFLASVDGKWVLGLLKSGRLTIYLDPVHHSKGLHHIEVTAVDGCGNTSSSAIDVRY